MPTATLSDFCTIIQGGRHKLSGNNFVQSGYPAYGAGGINGKLSTYEFEGDAVVLSSIGARCGKCFFASGKWSSLANTQVIFADARKADPKFLWYQLNDESRWHRSGTGQPFIKPSDVKGHKVFLPPLPEQRRIAAILDQADALRSKRREALAQLDTLAQSIFIEMFGDPVTNTKGLPQSKLQTVASLINGRAFKPNEWEDEGLPIIRIQNLNDDTKRFNHTTQILPDKFKVRPNEILFSWSGTPGTSFGCFRWRGGEGWLNQHIFKVLLDQARLDGDFFIQLMNLKLGEFISQAHGGVGLQHVTKGMIDETLLLLPALAHQKEFSERLQFVNTLEKLEKGSLGELESLFTSLQHRAFRGEL